MSQRLEVQSSTELEEVSVIESVEVGTDSSPQNSSPSPSINDSTRNDFPDGGWEANLVLLGSFLGLISNLGVINAIGAVQTYVSINQLQNVKTSTVSWIFSIYLALAYGVGLFIGPVFDRHGPKWILVVGTILIAGGFVASANCTKVWQFILALSICVGVGNGVATTPLVGVINHWFFIKRGNATGIATSGGSIGGLVIPLMLRSLYTKYGFPWAIRILALFCFSCMSASVILVKGRVRKTATETNALTAEHNLKTKILSLITNTFKNLDFKALKDLKYAYLICGAFATELSLVLIVTYFATYAVAQGVNESTSYILIVVWNGLGILGRWLPGYISDFWGKFNMNIMMLLGYTLSIFILWLPFGSSLKVLYAFAAIGGFFSGSILSMVPACLSQITPVKDFGGRYGLLSAFLSIGNLVGVPIGASIIGDGSKHNYDMFVVLVGMLAFLGTFMWLISRYCIVGYRINVKV